MCRYLDLVFLLFMVIHDLSYGLTPGPPPTPPALSCNVGETVLSALFFGVAENAMSAKAEKVSTLLSAAEMEAELRTQMTPLVTEDVSSLELTKLLDLSSIYYSLLAYPSPWKSTAAELKTSLDLLRLLLEEKVLDMQEDEEKQFLRWNIGKLSDQEIVLIGCGVGFIAPAGIPCTDINVNAVYTGSGRETPNVETYQECQLDCKEEATCMTWSWYHTTNICKLRFVMDVGETESVDGSCSGFKECGGSQKEGVDLCYSPIDESYKKNVTATPTYDGDNKGCLLACRRAGFMYMVLAEKDNRNACMCSSSVQKYKSVTDLCSVEYTTTGLGRQSSLREEFSPSDSSTIFNYLDGTTLDKAIVDAKTFQQAGKWMTVMLYKDHCAIISLKVDPQAEEDNQGKKAEIIFKDHKRWDLATVAGFDGSYDATYKHLLEPKDTNEGFLGDTGWTPAVRPAAIALTILPIFVTFDETFKPDKAIHYDVSTGQIDYDHDSWTSDNNMAGQPIAGGKWYNHIIITHKSSRPFVPGSKPAMTMIRILDDGTLLHILDRNVDRGQFEVADRLFKNPTDVMGFTRGRHSFAIVSSNSPTSTKSVVEGYEIIEYTEQLTLHAIVSYFKAVPMDFQIDVNDVVKTEVIDFLYTSYLVVLDRPSPVSSRLRLFRFYRTSTGEYVVDDNAAGTEQIAGVFTKMYSFVNDGYRYVVVSNLADNIVNVYLVGFNGQMSLVQTLTEENVFLVDVKPVRTGVAGNEVELLLVQKTIEDVSAYRLTCRVMSFDPLSKTWHFDQRRKVFANDIVSVEDVYEAFEVFNEKSRSYGMLFRNRKALSHVDMVRINSVADPFVDSNLKKESDIVARINMLDRRLHTNADSLLKKFDSAKDNLGSHLLDSGSVVTGNWDIKTLKVGRVLDVEAVPASTKVTVKVKADTSTGVVDHTTGDFRKVIDVDLALVKSKLEKVDTGLLTLQQYHDDLLLLDTGDSSSTQSVGYKLIVDEFEVTDEFKMIADPSSTYVSDLKVTTLAKDTTIWPMSDLNSIYSVGENQEVTGVTTLTGPVKVNGQLSSVKLASDILGTKTVVTTDQLLRYDQPKTFTAAQQFDGVINVSGDLELTTGVNCKDASGPAIEIDLSKDASITAILGHVEFRDKIVVEANGLAATQLETTFKTIDKSHIVTTVADSVEINGKLVIKAENADFSATGTSLSVVDGNLNSKNVKTLYDNAAWATSPPSRSLPSNYENVFTTAFTFTGSLEAQNAEIFKLNGYDSAKYVKKSDWDSGLEIAVGGVKTLKSVTKVGEIFAKTYNTETLDKFITKSTEQGEFSSKNTFNAKTVLVNILAEDKTVPPTIDGVDMVALLSTDIPSIVAASYPMASSHLVDRNINFAKLKIGPHATIKLTGTMNGIDLKDRFSNIVLSTDSSVTISGDKTFKEAVVAKKVIADTFIVKEGSNDVTPVTYKLNDFVNRLNTQAISGKKRFRKQVTYGNMLVVGDATKVNTVKVAPLLQCWININSDDVIEINNKISFEHLQTPGFKINREGSPRDCTFLENSLQYAAIWLLPADDYKALADKDDDATLRTALIAYLYETLNIKEFKSKSDARTLHDTDVGGLTDYSFLAKILTESPLNKKSVELEEMSLSDMRTIVEHYLSLKFGIKLSTLVSKRAFEMARLTCGLPKLNQKDVLTDLALLDQDNVFGTVLLSNSNNVFSGGLEANRVVVGGALQAMGNQRIFGVDLSTLNNERVSLTNIQTLSGVYSFADMRLMASGTYNGGIDIAYPNPSSSLSLASYISKFLKKSSSNPQTFTKARKVSKLTASTSVSTPNAGKHIAVDGIDYNIAKIYADHHRLDEDLVITGNLKFNDKLTVAMNTEVTGSVDGVNLVAFAKDIVVTGKADINVDGMGGSPGFSIFAADSGTIIPFSGKKIFSKALSVSSISSSSSAVNNEYVPTLFTAANSGGIIVHDGSSVKILTTDDDQTITGTFSVVAGNVLMKSDIKTDSVDGILVSDINDLYSYDDANSVHEIKHQTFEGDLVISSLAAKTVDGNNWEEFVADALAGPSASDTVSVVIVTGKKKFSNDVTIDQTDTTLNSLNKKDISAEYAAAAFVNKATTFTGSNTFSGHGLITITGGSLLAVDSLQLTDSTIDGVGSLEWLYLHTVKKDVNQEYKITGKLQFSKSLQLSADSTVGSLAEDNGGYSILVPADLIKLDTTAFKTSNGGGKHSFAGVTLVKDTKVTGKLAGFPLTKFSTVLYQTGDQSIAGTKTFSKASMSNPVTSTGAVNGLDLNTNLVYLADASTLQGNYKFNGDVSIKTMAVSGNIDGVDYDTISSRLLYTDTDQTISAEYTFECPALDFTAEIVGDGSLANGEGFVNGQNVTSLKAVGNTWKRVAAVKVSAQAEAMVLCSHVSDLGEAYLSTVEESSYTALSTSPTPLPMLAMRMLRFGDTTLGVFLTTKSVAIAISPKFDYNFLNIMADGNQVSGLRSIDIVNLIRHETIYSFFMLLVCDQGMVVVEVSGDASGRNLEQKALLSGVVGVSVVSELKTVLLVTKDMGSNAFTVKSLATSDIDKCANTRCSPSDWSLITHWTGVDFTEAVTPNLNTILIHSTNTDTDTDGYLAVAVSDGLDSVSGLFVRCFDLPYKRDNERTATFTTFAMDQRLVAVDTQDFVLVSSEGKVYLVSGGRTVRTTQLWPEQSFVAEVPTMGSKLRRHDSETVTMLEDAASVVFFKYAGVDGMQFDKRVFATNSPLVSYTILRESSKANGVMATASLTNWAHYSIVAPSYAAVDLQCRYPEVDHTPTTATVSQYCDKVANGKEHTMCKFDKPSETCDIVNKDLSVEFKNRILTSHNDYRRTVAKGFTSNSGLKQASNMVELTWSTELAKIAQMWSNQCNPGHDINRNTLDGGQIGQNVLAFKNSADWEATESTMQQVVDYWYNEVKDMNKGNVSPFKFADATGHFTQLAWAATAEIGCGLTEYINQEEIHPYIALLVCNYKTTGNVQGQEMWKTGQPCSPCPAAHPTCNDGLCAA